MGAPPPTSTGNLAGALGLTNTNPWQNSLAALGKGMSAVGKTAPGASAGTAFAAGFGGGLEGGLDQEGKQQAQLRQAKNDLFTQSSGAFKDMLSAQDADDKSAYRAAQGNYLAARAKSLELGQTGKGGSGAWQNTPYGKVISVENEAQKYEKGQQIVLQKRWALNGATPEQQQQDLDRLSKNVEAYRGRLYKSAGVDPKQADKIKDMGTAADNPFETKGMTLDDFNTQVPMGAWFKDQNGVARQRTKPPGGQSAAPATTTAPTASNNDDYLAMTGT